MEFNLERFEGRCREVAAPYNSFYSPAAMNLYLENEGYPSKWRKEEYTKYAAGGGGLVGGIAGGVLGVSYMNRKYSKKNSTFRWTLNWLGGSFGCAIGGLAAFFSSGFAVELLGNQVINQTSHYKQWTHKKTATLVRDVFLEFLREDPDFANYLCPLSQDVMICPVIWKYGEVRNFDRSSLLSIARNNRIPVPNHDPIEVGELEINYRLAHDIYTLIEEKLKQQLERDGLDDKIAEFLRDCLEIISDGKWKSANGWVNQRNQRVQDSSNGDNTFRLLCEQLRVQLRCGNLVTREPTPPDIRRWCERLMAQVF